MTPTAIPLPIVPLLTPFADAAAPFGVALDVATEVEGVLAIVSDEVAISDASS